MRRGPNCVVALAPTAASAANPAPAAAPAPTAASGSNLAPAAAAAPQCGLCRQSFSNPLIPLLPILLPLPLPLALLLPPLLPLLPSCSRYCCCIHCCCSQRPCPCCSHCPCCCRCSLLQAMADFARLVLSIKSKYGSPNRCGHCQVGAMELSDRCGHCQREVMVRQLKVTYNRSLTACGTPVDPARFLPHFPHPAALSSRSEGPMAACWPHGYA